MNNSYYTNLVNEEVSKSLIKLITIENDEEADIVDVCRLFSNVYEDYLEDYKKFPDHYSLDLLDSKYDEDKRRFYNKYYDFAKLCKRYDDKLRISGYGSRDVLKVRIREICKSVEYNFPFGWKRV